MDVTNRLTVHRGEFAQKDAPLLKSTGHFFWQSDDAKYRLDLPSGIEEFFLQVVKFLYLGKAFSLTLEGGELQLSNPIRARLDEFRKLADGWYEGSGRVPKSEGLDWLADFLEKTYPADLPQPYIYPTEEGGVNIEWPFGGKPMPDYQTPLYEVSLTLNLETKRGEWFCMNMKTDEYEDKELDLNKSEDWRWALERLYQCQKEVQ